MMYPESLTAIEVLVRYLEAEGVEYIFGIPGGSITPLYETIHARSKIRNVLVKHEESAAFAAQGYAAVSRKIGVCCATTGPGGTNAVTGVATAYADSIPMLFLTAQVSTRMFGMGAFQESSAFGVDLVELYRPITKMSAMVPRAEALPTLVQRALRLAMSGRPGPVHLSLPADVVKQDIEHTFVPPSAYRPRGAVVDRHAAATAAQLLAKAERPCILAGHGVSVSGAALELRRLAEHLKVPVATTPKAKGVFPENHPLSLGVFGFAGHPRADAYIMAGNLDVLVVIGSSLGEWSSHAWDKRIKASRAFIQINVDPVEIGKNYPADVGVVGDARAALAEILEHVGALPAMGGAAREEELNMLRQTVPRYYDSDHFGPYTGGLKPQQVIQEMQEAIPQDALLFVDIGNCISWAGHYYEVREPDSYFINLGIAAMGHAVGGAIGAKLAAPDRPVVALLGDGAFLMNGLDVHTATEYRVPVVWIVLNNGGHGMVYQGDKLMLGRDLNSTLFRNPIDIGSIATALGAQGYRCATRESLRKALTEALASGVPSVIEAVIDKDEVPAALKHRVKTLDKAFNDTESISPTSIRLPYRRV